MRCPVKTNGCAAYRIGVRAQPMGVVCFNGDVLALSNNSFNGLSVGHLHDVQTANGSRDALASGVEARYFDSRALLLEAVNRRSGEGFHLKSGGRNGIGCGEALLKGVHFVGRHKEVYRCAGGEESLLVQFGYSIHLIEGNGGETRSKESLFANAAWAAFKCDCGESFATRKGFCIDRG